MDRMTIAAMAMQGILVGSYTERPNARPPAGKVAVWAFGYADALIAEDQKQDGPAEAAG